MDERATRRQAERDNRSRTQPKPKGAEPARGDGAGPAEADLAASSPGPRASEAGPAGQSVVAEGVGDTEVTIGEAVVDGVTGSGSRAAVVGEDGEEGAEQRDGAMEEGEVSAQEMEGLVPGVSSPGMLAELMSGLSSGEEEEEDEDESEEDDDDMIDVDSEASLPCGQPLVISIERPSSESVSKKARVEVVVGVDVGGGASAATVDGGSEEESASSPLSRRRQQSNQEGLHDPSMSGARMVL